MTPRFKKGDIVRLKTVPFMFHPSQVLLEGAIGKVIGPGFATGTIEVHYWGGAFDFSVCDWPVDYLEMMSGGELPVTRRPTYATPGMHPLAGEASDPLARFLFGSNAVGITVPEPPCPMCKQPITTAFQMIEGERYHTRCYKVNATVAAQRSAEVRPPYDRDCDGVLGIDVKATEARAAAWRRSTFKPETTPAALLVDIDDVEFV